MVTDSVLANMAGSVARAFKRTYEPPELSKRPTKGELAARLQWFEEETDYWKSAYATAHGANEFLRERHARIPRWIRWLFRGSK